MPRMQKPIVSKPSCPHVVSRPNAATDDIKLRILAANLRKQFAKDIPFTDEYIVGKALGGFAVGDSVKDLSIAEILIKLLGLTEVAVGPDAPPDVPPSVGEGTLAESIIQIKAPVYQINDNFEIVEVAFKYITFNEASYSAEPSDRLTTFYQKLDSTGKVTESGYQHCTDMQEMYYLVALPEEMIIGENVKIQTWSAVEGCWRDLTSPLTNDYDEICAAFMEVGLSAPSRMPGYTLWVDLNDIDPGTSYRYIIID